MNSQPRRARRASPRGRALHTPIFPDSAGVYFFLGRDKRPLYIGRATSLRTRVRSYFADSTLENPSTSLGARRSPWIAQMLERAKSVEYKKTASVLEAILLEADLIKKWKPPYNTKEKDDKSFNCIAITDEEFPRVLLVRSKDLSPLSSPPCVRGRRPDASRGEGVVSSVLKPPLRLASLGTSPWKRGRGITPRLIFGPFPHSAHVRDALKIVRKIFPFRDSCTPYSNILQNNRITKPCFNRQIGLCPGVCTGEISAREYRKHIARLALFLSGKTERVQKALEREMKRAARTQEFERAGELKRQLFALKHIQDVALLKTTDYLLPRLPIGGQATTHFRIESYDISHFGGKGIVGAMAVVEDGIARPSDYRLFKLRGITKQNEVAGLQEIIRRRLKHKEWPFPQLIVVDGNAVQKRAAERALAATGEKIPVVAVVKDEHHRPRGILGGIKYGSAKERAVLLGNSEAHRFVLRFQKRQRS